MNDPWGSFQSFMSNFQQLAQNPAQYAIKNFGVPKEMASNPEAIMQNLMSSGRISQEQYNAARRMASQIQGNPLFNQMIKRM